MVVSKILNQKANHLRSNIAVKAAPSGRWTLRDAAVQSASWLHAEHPHFQTLTIAFGSLSAPPYSQKTTTHLRNTSHTN